MAVNHGENIPFYISEFLGKEKSKIINGIEIDFNDWVKFIDKNPDIKSNIGDANKRTFNYYRNLWYKISFEKTFQEFYHKENFKGKQPYLTIDCERNLIKRFPQVSRILISSFIYKKLEEGLTDYDSIINSINTFIIQGEYKKTEDFHNFFKYYSSRKSRERNNINIDELLNIKSYLIKPEYKMVFNSYFKDLIEMIKFIRSKRASINDESRGVNISEIIRKFNVKFSKNELLEILKFLTRRYDLYFFFTQKEIDWLDENGINVNKIRNQKSRWYWINQNMSFRNSVTGEISSGTDIALKFFQKFIIPEFKNENLIPTANNFRNSKYRYFYEQLKKNQSHNDLLKYVGLEPIHEYPYAGMAYTDLKKIFKAEIYPFFNRLKSLPKNTAPLVEDISKYYRGFLNKIYETPKKTYLDFIRELGLQAQQSVRAEAGVILHEILRYLASVNNPYFYSEVKIFYPVRNYQVDGLLLNTKDFQEHIFKNFPLIYEVIKSKPYILFDYTNAFNFKGDLINLRIFKRIHNYFKNPSKEVLFIIGTHWNHECDVYDLPKIILHNNKKIDSTGVFLICPNLFRKILRIEDEFCTLFRKSISYNIKMNIKKLKEMLDYLINKEIELFSTEHLMKRLNTKSLIQIFDCKFKN